jgi:hypothetical protein
LEVQWVTQPKKFGPLNFQVKNEKIMGKLRLNFQVWGENFEAGSIGIGGE